MAAGKELDKNVNNTSQYVRKMYYLYKVVTSLLENNPKVRFKKVEEERYQKLVCNNNNYLFFHLLLRANNTVKLM